MTLFFALALLAGACVALQGPTNAALASRSGLPAALLVNALLATALSAGLWAVLRVPPEAPAGPAVPVHYLGGLYGFVILAASALAVARLGAARALTLLVAAQVSVALVLDHFGWLGLPRSPVTATRLAGVALVVAGASLVRR